MADWKFRADIDRALEEFSTITERCEHSGLEATAAKAADVMEAESERAFAELKDPRTGRRWEPPAETTLRDPRFERLLERSGQLRAAVRGAYRVGPSIATARIEIAEGELVKRAMVHLYGVKARSKRSNRATRKRPGQAMPARRFVGVSPARVKELITFAEGALFKP